MTTRGSTTQGLTIALASNTVAPIVPVIASAGAIQLGGTAKLTVRGIVHTPSADITLAGTSTVTITGGEVIARSLDQNSTSQVTVNATSRPPSPGQTGSLSPCPSSSCRVAKLFPNKRAV